MPAFLLSALDYDVIWPAVSGPAPTLAPSNGLYCGIISQNKPFLP